MLYRSLPDYKGQGLWTRHRFSSRTLRRHDRRPFAGNVASDANPAPGGLPGVRQAPVRSEPQTVAMAASGSPQFPNVDPQDGVRSDPEHRPCSLPQLPNVADALLPEDSTFLSIHSIPRLLDVT